MLSLLLKLFKTMPIFIVQHIHPFENTKHPQVRRVSSVLRIVEIRNCREIIKTK